MRLKSSKDSWASQLHWLFLGLAAIALTVWVLTDIVPALKGSFFVLAYFAAAVALFAILFMLNNAVKMLTEYRRQIDQINEILAAIKPLIQQTAQGMQLSETAKTLIYHDTDSQYLRAAVMDKLHQKDFKSTYAMIEDISHRNEYKELAKDLKDVADKYRDATDNDRLSQVTSYIDRLLDQYQWATASAQIENFIRNNPDLQDAPSLRQKLADKKELRKRQLLAEWDEAVKREDTDRSLIVLKELDMYLTPSEGLALQEAASQVFKSKLHNLGVQFALAVSDKHWSDALVIGQDIMKNFPNSKMADEIRGKLTTLRDLARK